MEIIVIILSTLIIPGVVIIGLILIGRRFSKEIQQKNRLVDTMENIIEMKKKIIQQLKSFHLLNKF